MPELIRKIEFETAAAIKICRCSVARDDAIKYVAGHQVKAYYMALNYIAEHIVVFFQLGIIDIEFFKVIQQYIVIRFSF